jgi:hypothetical protein
MNTFNLERFEHLCFSHSHEGAARELINILQILDSNYGSLSSNFSATAVMAVRTSSDAIDQHVLTRIATAVSALFSDPGFIFSDSGFFQMMPWHRWISTLFAASPSHNADHVLRSLNLNGYELDNFSVDIKNIPKFCFLYTPESEIRLDVEALWEAAPVLAANLFLVLMSPRFLGSPAAHSKREALLRWLPSRLNELGSLDLLPVGIMHDVYMHCSYADFPGKHDIKKPINALIRRKINDWGLVDVSQKTLVGKDKPVMLVVLEYFSVAHSIYRTHSTTLRAARELFHLVGIGFGSNVDDAGRAVFDDFLEIEKPHDLPAMLHQISKLAQIKQAQILYMPSVGMFPLTMFLSNLRVAPIQVMALGHPATTHSPCIDYVVVEEDYVGDPTVFSETLLQLPKDALPYVPSALASSLNLTPILTRSPHVVKIVVCSTTMKLNPNYLSACLQIADTAKSPVHFHFLIGQAVGLVWAQVNQVVKRYLGDRVTVHSHQNYASYMEIIRGCDLFLNPFPFGNTNGIVDTVSFGLVGICRSGAEVHEHIDEGMFGRLGLPAWMVTRSTEEYVTAAVRLIDNAQERLALREELIDKNGLSRLFTGRPELFGQALLKLLLDRSDKA